jgi:hypothetical protein
MALPFTHGRNRHQRCYFVANGAYRSPTGAPARQPLPGPGRGRRDHRGDSARPSGSPPRTARPHDQGTRLAGRRRSTPLPLPGPFRRPWRVPARSRAFPRAPRTAGTAAFWTSCARNPGELPRLVGAQEAAV